MNKEEMISKILEMIKEMYELNKDEISLEEIKKEYVKIKFVLETTKELKGVDK